MIAIRKLALAVPKNIAVRSLAAAAQPTEPIQKLFFDKNREYAAQSKTAPDGLVGGDAKLSKELANDIARVANQFQVKDEKNLANLGLKFEDTTKLDSINMVQR